MAQFYLADAWNVDSAVSQREMNKARAEFIPALELLRGAPEATSEIKRTLVLADAQWLFFDNAIKTGAKSRKPHRTSFLPAKTCCR
jgi:2-keto-4-pentenoate hydratase